MYVREIDSNITMPGFWHNIFIIIIFFSLTSFNYALETITLKNPIHFDRSLGRNNIFLKWCESFDAEGEFYYFLDSKYSIIFKVEKKTGKLIKTISSKGQGPFEIQHANYFRVRNGKIFVLDRGFNGIKIFDTSGKGINEIRIPLVLGDATIDVNEKNEIFIGRIDRENNALVAVYDVKGEKLRSIIPTHSGRKVNELDMELYYHIKLDFFDNIYIMFYLGRLLEKYDSNGRLLWSAPIENMLLNKWPKNEDVKRDKNNKIHTTFRIFGLNITPKNSVVIGHAGGGCIFSPDGKMKHLIKMESEIWPLNAFKIVGEKLINVAALGQHIYIYQFREE